MPHQSLSQYQQWYASAFTPPASGAPGIGNLQVTDAMPGIGQQPAQPMDPGAFANQPLQLSPEQLAQLQAQQANQQSARQAMSQPMGLAPNAQLPGWINSIVGANPTSPLNPGGPTAPQQSAGQQNPMQDMLDSLNQIKNMFAALLMFTGGMMQNSNIKPLSESINTQLEKAQQNKTATNNTSAQTAQGEETFAPAFADADKVNVTFIEAEAPDGATTHMKDVAGVFNYITGGKFAHQNTVVLKPDSGAWSTAEEYVTRAATHALNNVSGALKTMTDASDGSTPHVVNGSLQYSRVEIYKGLKAEMAENPQLAAEIGGTDDASIVKYVDGILAGSAEFKAALANYQAVTQAAADKKIAVVVAAGNSNATDADFGFAGAADGAGLNFLAMSNDVISVAATQLDDTTNNYVDDAMARFSSRGDGTFNPTITAPGGSLGKDSPLPGTSGVLNGTSFSAPIVEGVAAEAFAKNPNLTVAELRQKLIETAVDRPDTLAGFDARGEGAGILNREALLKAIDPAA
ncbi:MAG: S8 family serine peptidase [Candidatus Melainabacteria bacterium]